MVLNRKPLAGAVVNAIALTYVLACVSVTALPGPLAGDSTRQGGASSRFAVSFAEQDKQYVRIHLQQKGYRIVSEGPGFFAVTFKEADRLKFPASSTGAAVTPSRAKQAAGPQAKHSNRARRKLTEWQRQRQREQHLHRLSRIPGIDTSEHDLRRYLHVGPTAALQNSAAAAATAGAARRRLSRTADYQTASRQKAGAKAAAAASTAFHLTGHWHTSKSFRPSQYDIWGSSVGDPTCANNDTQLADTAGAEVLPWGIKTIGATNETLLKAQPKGRAIVCIIDSGISLEHPEYKQTMGAPNDQISGCSVSSNCPYLWSQDLVGHGTHVAGTVGAPRNGLGVIGVMSTGADIHVMRIWNDSGDVSQGQGPYATDLILAYDNCLAYLEQQQQKDKNTKMVINMSYGSAGPLTVERLWMAKAVKRGDVLFVSSAGNNGTFMAANTYKDKQSVDPGQYLSYPASFDEVLSVANMRCDGTIDFSSQKNRKVSISAPGMAILSSVPREYGAIRAYVNTNKPIPPELEPVETAPPADDPVDDMYGIAPPAGGDSSSSSSSSTKSSKTPKLQLRTGLGYLPSGYREPRAVQGTRIGSSGSSRIVQCNADADVRANAYYRPPNMPQTQAQVSGCQGVKGNVCIVQLPGQIDWYYETCLAMLKCIRGGGKGLIVWRNDTALTNMGAGGTDPDYYYGFQPDDFLLGTQINCGTRCACWAEMKKQLGCSGEDCGDKTPPGIVVSAKHAQALMAGSKASPEFRVNITNYEYNYRHYDGTSMSAPHVSGAAALLWRLFPGCKAADISQALKASAQKLPDQSDLAAGSGLLRVDRAYDWILKNKACAKD